MSTRTNQAPDTGRLQESAALGFGLGLRAEHYTDILSGPQPVDWFEAISENYMIPGGRPLEVLEKVRRDYPVVLHGVSLSIGSVDPLDEDYLHDLKALAARIEPAWISDHLCWTGVDGLNLHDLLPLPYSQEAIDHVAARVARVQDALGRRIALENVSTYVSLAESAMPEWDFVAAVAERADSLILLDVNNIYVNAFNHGFDPMDYLAAIPAERVVQFHLAGHENCGTHIIDTHDAPVIDDVWSLYARALEHFGPVATMIERDDRIPPLADLIAELNRAREIAGAILTAKAS